MANTADKVIQIALSQVGYCEKSKQAYKSDPSVLYKFTDGAGKDNYTKYGKEMHELYPAVMDFPAAWCDCFVDWCFYQAYGITNAKGLLGGNFDDYTPNSAGLYKKKNAYWRVNPKKGDQIFFNNGTRICHTGLVYDVDDKYVYTVEGNTSGGNTLISNGGCVAKKKYPLTYERIDGYGRPKYDEQAYPVGWNKNTATGQWWYQYGTGKNEYYSNSIKEIDGKLYAFGKDGYMKQGAFTVTTDGDGAIATIQ